MLKKTFLFREKINKYSKVEFKTQTINKGKIFLKVKNEIVNILCGVFVESANKTSIVTYLMNGR